MQGLQGNGDAADAERLFVGTMEDYDRYLGERRARGALLSR